MLALLWAVARSAYREIRSLGSIQGNNFFFFALLLSMQPEAALFLWTILGLVMMPAAISAPLARIPAIRLDLWPITSLQSRLLAPFTRPESQSSPTLWRLVPTLELRQILRTLDFWFAVLLAVLSALWRLLAKSPTPTAYPVLTMLIVLALSTIAQNVFAMDGIGGRQRWKLSPTRGIVLLLRKDAWLIALAVLLTLHLHPLGALAGMLAALAVGHHFSVLSPLDAGPWRFVTGQFFPFGFLQVIGMFSCGVSVARGDWFYLALAAIVWLISLVIYGYILERS